MSGRELSKHRCHKTHVHVKYGGGVDETMSRPSTTYQTERNRFLASRSDGLFVAFVRNVMFVLFTNRNQQLPFFTKYYLLVDTH